MALSKPEKELLCPICSQIFKSPKILECLHTFCEQCIHEYILSFGQSKEDKLTEIPCPFCKVNIKPRNAKLYRTNWASTLRPNFVLTAMLAEKYGNTQQVCDVCRDHKQTTKAYFWCNECKQAICKNCKSKHDWLTGLKTHPLCSLEEFRIKNKGIDFDVISEKCEIHTTEIVQSCCIDHNTICCNTCITLDHRNCKQIEPIADFINSDQVKDKVQGMKTAKEEVSHLLHRKLSDIDSFEEKATKIEDDTATLVKSLKFKLNELFETFIKQLHIARDDKLSDMDANMRVLNQMMLSLEHWINSAELVKEFGSNIQFVIYFTKIEKELKQCVKKLVKIGNAEETPELEFRINAMIEQVQNVDQLGTISVGENGVTSQNAKLKKLSEIWGLYFTPTFETVKVMKVDTFVYPLSRLRCGVCVNDKQMLLGFYNGSWVSKLVLVNTNGTTISTTQFNGSVKRLCYIPEDAVIYISCYCGKMFRAVYDGTAIQQPVLIKNGSENVGDLKYHEDQVYVVCEGSVQKFNRGTYQTLMKNDNTLKMTKYLETDTNSKDLNGIYVDDDRMVFISSGKEIKCVAFDGNEIFCFRNTLMSSPSCLTVLPSGFILIGDENGTVHVLTADGKQSRVLVHTTEKIKRITDMWLDKNNEKLYIAGGCEYLEVYKLLE